jgi:hypothetical protein
MKNEDRCQEHGKKYVDLSDAIEDPRDFRCILCMRDHIDLLEHQLKAATPEEPVAWIYVEKGRKPSGATDTLTRQPPDRVMRAENYDITPLYKRPAQDELSAIHHALLNPMEVVYDPSEAWTVRTAKQWIIAARKSGTFVGE